MSARLAGVDRFHTTTAAAVAALGDLHEPGQAAARLIESTASGTAPRRTGRLVASASASAAERRARVEYGAVYAPVVHYGWAKRGIREDPFLTRAAQRTEPTWVGFYETATAAAVDMIEGT